MLSTAIALILFICLLITLEMSQRANSKAVMELAAARADIEGLLQALVNRDKEVRYYAQQARAAEQHNIAAALSLTQVCVAADEVEAMHAGRIENLCGQLEEARKGRRYYFDQAGKYAQEVRTLSCELAESRLASFANLSDMTRLSAIQQENKLDSLCEVIKTLMNRDQLDDAAVASFGGRLSRAVQVYRKDRKAAVCHIDTSPYLIPGLAHLMNEE